MCSHYGIGCRSREGENLMNGEEKDGRWRCPTCQVEADVKGRNIHVYVTGQRWPLHDDCEFCPKEGDRAGLGQDIDNMDFSKLERVS